jgi:hypothetical protein
MIKALFVVAIVTFAFCVNGLTSARSDKLIDSRKSRLSRRSFAAPDAEKTVSTAETGLMGVLAAMQHTVDNGYKLMIAKPAAVPVTPNTGNTAKTVAGFGDITDNSKSA